MRKSILTVDPILKSSFIAITSDNGSNMISSRGESIDPNGAGVVNQLVKESPNLTFVRNLFHLFNLIIEESMETMPLYIVEFIRKICVYFNKDHKNCLLKEG